MTKVEVKTLIYNPGVIIDHNMSLRDALMLVEDEIQCTYVDGFLQTDTCEIMVDNIGKFLPAFRQFLQPRYKKLGKEAELLFLAGDNRLCFALLYAVRQNLQRAYIALAGANAYFSVLNRLFGAAENPDSGERHYVLEPKTGKITGVYYER